MKNKLYTLFLAVCFCVTSHSFTQNVKIGELDLGKHRTLEKIIGADKESIYLMSLNMLSMSGDADDKVVKVSRKNLTQEYIKEIKIEGKDNNYFENGWLIKNQLILFFYLYNSKEEKYVIKACALDKDGNIVRGPLEVMSVKEEKDKDIYNWDSEINKYGRIKDYGASPVYLWVRHSFAINISLSNDSSSFMLWNVCSFNQKKAPALQAKLIDVSFNTLYETTMELPYDKNGFYFGKAFCKKNGDFFLTSYVYPLTENDLKKKKSNINYEKANVKIISLLKNGKDLKIYNATDTAKYYLDDNIIVNDNNKIIFSSIFSEQKNQQEYGMTFQRINADNFQIEINHTTYFDQAYIKLFMGDAYEKKKSMSFFHIDHFMPDNATGYYIIAEQYLKSYIVGDTPPMFNGGMSNGAILFPSDNILQLHIDDNGILQSKYIIPKKQTPAGWPAYYYGSYFFDMDKKNNCYYIFNDNEKNLNIPENQKSDLNNYKEIVLSSGGNQNSVATFTKIDLNGKISRKIFPSEKEKDKI